MVLLEQLYFFANWLYVCFPSTYSCQTTAEDTSFPPVNCFLQIWHLYSCFPLRIPFFLLFYYHKTCTFFIHNLSFASKVMIPTHIELSSLLFVYYANLLNIQANLAIVLNLVGATILTEFFWNKKLGKETKYRKRSWLKPAIISVIITIPFILAIIYG